MSETVTNALYGLAVSFVAAVCVTRTLLLPATTPGRRVDIALALAALCCLLRMPAIMAAASRWSGHPVLGQVIYQLAETAVLPTCGSLFLVAYGWLDRREPRCLAGLVYGASFLFAALVFWVELVVRARRANSSVQAGWEVVASTKSPGIVFLTVVAHDSLIYWFSITVFVSCIRELIHRGPQRRVVGLIVALAALSAITLSQTIGISVAVVLEMRGHHNGFVMLLATSSRYMMAVYAVVLAGIASIPFFSLLADWLHIDRYSRVRRKLLPLWRDLTTACPEVVYPADVGSYWPRYRLHRTVVEIRDCILALSPYSKRCEQQRIHQLTCDTALQEAVTIALGWKGKLLGLTAEVDAPILGSSAEELLEETAELRRIADEWDRAKPLALSILMERDERPVSVGDDA